MKKFGILPFMEAVILMLNEVEEFSKDDLNDDAIRVLDDAIQGITNFTNMEIWKK